MTDWVTLLLTYKSYALFRYYNWQVQMEIYDWKTVTGIDGTLILRTEWYIIMLSITFKSAKQIVFGWFGVIRVARVIFGNWLYVGHFPTMRRNLRTLWKAFKTSQWCENLSLKNCTNVTRNRRLPYIEMLSEEYAGHITRKKVS